MGKQLEKAIERLLSKPSDYTYDELKALLKKLGYEEMTKGKTSGSRVKFFNSLNGKIIMIHKPHPSPYLKKYMFNEVINSLKQNKEI